MAEAHEQGPLGTGERGPIGSEIACKNASCREQSGFNGREDSFTALKKGQTGGIADQQVAIAGDGASRRAVKKIGMAVKRRDVKGNPGSRFQELQEAGNVRRQLARISSPQTYIQNVIFAKTPAVSFHIGTEVQFRRVPLDATGCALACIHFKLDLLSNHWRFAAFFGAQKSSD